MRNRGTWEGRLEHMSSFLEMSEIARILSDSVCLLCCASNNPDISVIGGNCGTLGQPNMCPTSSAEARRHTRAVRALHGFDVRAAMVLAEVIGCCVAVKAAILAALKVCLKAKYAALIQVYLWPSAQQSPRVDIHARDKLTAPDERSREASPSGAIKELFCTKYVA